MTMKSGAKIVHDFQDQHEFLQLQVIKLCAIEKLMLTILEVRQSGLSYTLHFQYQGDSRACGYCRI